jgi:hypothetical protein
LSERGNRLQGSVLTFGPVGRILCTVGVLAVLAWFLVFGGLFGVVGAVVWSGWVLPRALRDTWRRAALPSTDLTRCRDEAARQLAEQQRPRTSNPAFDPEAPRPTRW